MCAEKLYISHSLFDASLIRGSQSIDIERFTGLRVVVEAHGGHFWATQGSVQRPLDVTSLRIDAQERMGLQLADALISPTHYMAAFLRERAWRLPRTSLVIPNVLPPPEPGRLLPEVSHTVCQFSDQSLSQWGVW